eukprot:gnl/Hemi2/17587_TR5801_c0_g1_i1.p1 gnl/Hemi2/17587_TR5801_c0_g1~~gnl/Hemi2/17587_TR5801_c0_g1_i1.p1  ORF type:complete len:474 (-),score=114.38 gnl/Hemi2/17587_TR5801_c0_g1_i1:174-1595(-)
MARGTHLLLLLLPLLLLCCCCCCLASPYHRPGHLHMRDRLAALQRQMTLVSSFRSVSALSSPPSSSSSPSFPSSSPPPSNSQKGKDFLLRCVLARYVYVTAMKRKKRGGGGGRGGGNGGGPKQQRGPAESTPRKQPSQQSIQKAVNLEEYRVKARVSGLQSSAERCRLWPMLLGLDLATVNYEPPSPTAKRHKDYEQIECDIGRSVWRFTQQSSDLRGRLEDYRAQLSRVLHTIFTRHSDLNYYQGFHDVCSVFLLVGGEKFAFALGERVALYHLRSCLRSTFEEVTQVLDLVFPLVELCDLELHRFLKRSEVMPAFAISWVLTWFAHRLDNLDAIARIYDFMLVSHPLTSLYMSVEVIRFLKADLLQQECDLSAVHSFFEHLPPLPVDTIIHSTAALFDRHPPSSLLQFSQVAVDRESALLKFPYPWCPSPPTPRTLLSYPSVRVTLLGGAGLLAVAALAMGVHRLNYSVVT